MYGDLPRYAPEGWKYLGQGCYRGAYRSPDNVVYKVQIVPGVYSGQSNLHEYRTWWILRLSHRMPEGARFPMMNFFGFEGNDDVNAMEYVGRTLNKCANDADYYRYSDTLRKVARQLELWDMHHANAAVDEKSKLIVPIDLG